MIEGNFYKSIYGIDTYYFKLKNIIGDYVFANNYYVYNTMYVDDPYITSLPFNKRARPFEETFLDEFVHLLPDNHPDKKHFMRNKKIIALLSIL